MPFEPPVSAALGGVSQRHGLSWSDVDVASFGPMVYGLHAAYDQGLAFFEVLIRPTVPRRATILPSQDAPREEIDARTLEMTGNIGPFDVTGHPACSVPAGLAGGLPVGMMIVGKCSTMPSSCGWRTPSSRWPGASQYQTR
jgi:hypothetical protein